MTTKRFPSTARRPRGALLIAASTVLLLSVSGCPARAAFEVSWPDARSAAMLSPGSGLDLEFASALPATGADSLSMSPGAAGHRITVSAGELYGVREAAGWGVRGETGVRSVPVRVEFSRLGGDLYEERVVSVGTCSSAGRNLSVSAKLRLLGIAARGVDDRWAVAFDAGVARRLMGRLLFGASCGNLGRTTIGDSPVPTRTVFGAALVLPSSSLQWTLLLEGSFQPASTLAFEASLTDWLRIRAGARSEPGRVGFGIGVGPERRSRRSGRDTRGVSWPAVDVSIQWHPRLGVSSFVSVSITR